MKILAMDIGGTFIKYALMKENCEFVEKGKVPTPLTNMEDLFQTLKMVWESYCGQAEGVAISMPGVIDSERGYAYNAGALEYLRERPFAKELSDLLGCKVWIGNDAKCAGIAEVGYGCLQDVQDAFVLIFGTAIGGCMIKDRKVHNGRHFSAGEVSNLRIDYTKPYDPQKSWYYLNGAHALLQLVQQHLHTKETYSGEEIFAMAKDGSEEVLHALEEFCERIALQILNIQVIFDAERVAIGGGISAQPLLLELIQKKFDEIYDSFYLPVYRPEITVCKFFNDANLIGAYYQFQTTLIS